MKCIKCSELIIINRNFNNLFKIKHQLLCNRCQKEIVYDHYYEAIPIESGLIHHYFLKYDQENIDPKIMQFLLEPFYWIAIKKQLPLLYFDQIDDDLYHILDNLIWGNLIIITIN